jgi:Ca2+-binding RTX toxin-like protein
MSFPTIAATTLFVLAAVVTQARAATVDLVAGVLLYDSPIPGSVANALTVSLAAGTYTIDDPAEAAVALTANAAGGGCAPVDANTVTCPAAAILSFQILPRLGDDTVVLTGAPHPALVAGGDGNDTIVGGTAHDTFAWGPGDDDDVIDGGPGSDTLAFDGSSASEAIAITPDGAGFALTRNVAAVLMQVQRTETLVVRTMLGADTVVTTPLEETAQVLVDGDDAQADVLTLDAAGLCPFQVGDTLEVLGRQPVQFSGFATVNATNAVCGAILDLSATTLSYTALLAAANNALDVALAGDTYTIHDAGEIISVTPNAFAQGCANTDANTVACPAAAITAFDVATRHGDDTIDLSGAAHPAVVAGGVGADTIVGGASDDVFRWGPGDGNDVLDGGPGSDTLAFTGSGAHETYTIGANGGGFDLFRNVGAVELTAQGTETLTLSTLGGIDSVLTTGLAATRQVFTDTADASAGTVTVDAQGLCAVQQGGSVEIEGYQPIRIADFASTVLYDSICRPNPCEGALVTLGCKVNGLRDQPCQGTPGDDVIVGTPGPDVILGGGGRDRIRAGAGDDVVCGEEGDDKLAGASGYDTLAGGPGADTLKGSSDDDTLLGGDDGDTLAGGSGSDVLDGGLGDDRIRGAVGADGIDGGGGEDVCTDSDQLGPFIRCELP